MLRKGQRVSRTLIRWSGMAGMAGGLLWIVLAALTRQAWTDPVFGLTYEDYNRIMPIPRLLVLATLIAFYIRQEGRSGKLGLAGFSLGLIGLSLMVAGGVVEFWLGGGVRRGDRTLSYAGWHMVIAGAPTLYLGLVLFGVATSRARVLPGWRRMAPLFIPLLLHVTAAVDVGLRSSLGIQGPVVISFGIGFGWVLLGYAIYSHTTQQRLDGAGGTPRQ